MKVSPALKDRALLRRVLGLVGPYWFFVVSSLICAAVSVAAQLLARTWRTRSAASPRRPARPACT